MLNLMPDLIEIIALIISGIVAVTLLMFYLKEHQKSGQRLNQTSTPSLKDSQQKSYSILHRAYRQAQTILGRAELESVKITADSRASVRQMEDKYEAQLDKAASKLESDLTTQLQQAQQKYTGFLEDLKAQAQQTQLLNQEYTKQKTNELFEKFEQHLVDFLTSTEQKSVSSIELEMRAAKQLIDTYKAQQLALIDENIIAMLEKTLSVVLAKKLSLKDQMDLVYEALEKAKVEKLIA